MTQVQIQTKLEPRAAVALALTEHGYLLVTPTAEQLSALGAEERELLGDYVAPPHECDRFAHYAVLFVLRPGWEGVTGALATRRAEAAKEAAEKAANVERERASYRRLIQMVETGQYFQPGTMPPAERDDLDVEWKNSPNYSAGDAEAKRLWEEFSRLRKAERSRLILGADEALGEDVDAHIVGDLEGVSPAVEALLKTREWVLGKYRYDPEPTRALAVHNEINLRRKGRAEVRAEVNRAALRDLIGGYGSPDQLERFDVGALPDSERNNLIYPVLFAPLDSFSRYEPIDADQVADACDCDRTEVRFSSHNHEGDFTADQWSRLKEIRKAAPATATVSVREHIGYERGAEGADDPDVRRLGVRVTIEFAGEKFTDEFAL